MSQQRVLAVRFRRKGNCRRLRGFRKFSTDPKLLRFKTSGDINPRDTERVRARASGLDSPSRLAAWTPSLNWRPGQPRCNLPLAQSGKPDSLGPGSAAEARLPQRPYPRFGLLQTPGSVHPDSARPRPRCGLHAEQELPAACGRSPAPRRAGLPPLVYTAPRRPPRRWRAAGAAPCPLEQRQPATALSPKQVVESELKWRGLRVVGRREQEESASRTLAFFSLPFLRYTFENGGNLPLTGRIHHSSRSLP